MKLHYLRLIHCKNCKTPVNPFIVSHLKLGPTNIETVAIIEADRRLLC